MCVYDALAVILNNLHILKMLKVSHLARPPRIWNQHLRIEKKNIKKAV